MRSDDKVHHLDSEDAGNVLQVKLFEWVELGLLNWKIDFAGVRVLIQVFARSVLAVTERHRLGIQPARH